MDDAQQAALRLVEKLISNRLQLLQQRAADPTISKRSALGLRQRADELGVLIGAIRKARLPRSGLPD